MHTLYMAAHGTAVALGAHVTELQHRLEVGARRQHPFLSGPAVQDIIARFSGFEQLAAAYVAGRAATSANHDQVKGATPGARLATALAAWEIQAHRTLGANPDRLIWFAWLKGRHCTQPTSGARLRAQPGPTSRNGLYARYGTVSCRCYEALGSHREIAHFVGHGSTSVTSEYRRNCGQ
jgi:hypothetical protein